MRLHELSSDQTLKSLTHAGLIVLAFDLVKNLVIKPVELFYKDTTFGNGLPFKNYREDVVAKHKNLFEATLIFLRDHFEAISTDDINAIQQLRNRRNDIAHNLPILLPDLNPQEDRGMLLNARQALFKLSNFWIYIELGSDPEFILRDIDWSTVCGPELALLDKIIEETLKTA